VLLLLPVGVVFAKTFEHGFGVAWNGSRRRPRSAPSAVAPLAAIAVPLNTIFGVGCA
jgi:ABC-type sulfate transport system permease subunit